MTPADRCVIIHTHMERIGRYELSAKLGHGGMGVVYRGFDTLLQRTVAVKLIGAQIHDQPGMRERFFREARAAGQLSHKNIITVHDLGEENGQPFLAMEFLDGEDLQQRLNHYAKPSLTAKIDIAIQICEGLEYAHTRGVIHRDIKPANIFITTSGVVKILDFGLARLGASQLTNTGMVMGTINYMAPEQVRGEKADHRADIFSTGVLMYEMFSGRKAFEGDSFAATLMKILQEAPEPLDRVDPNIPPELTQIVDRALAKRLDQRYQTMSELRADLQAVRRQFDSPTILAHVLGPSDPTALVSSGVHDRTVSEVPSSRAPHSGVPVGRTHHGTTPMAAGSGARSTIPTARLDAEAREALNTASPARSSHSKRMLAAAAVLALVFIGAAALWLASGTGAPTTASQPPNVAPPTSQANALTPAPQPSDAPARAGDTPAQPAPSADTSPPAERPAAGPPKNTTTKPVDTPKTAAPPTGVSRGQRPDPRAAEAAGAKTTKVDPPKPATNPAPMPTVPPPSGSPEVLPTAPVVSTSPPPTAPPPPAPAAPPEKKGPTPEEGMNELVERYRSALEGRDFNALRRIWPGLSGAVADSHREQFKNASRIVADITNRQIKVSNGGGTIIFVRRYVVTLDGKDYQQTSTATMTARQTSSGWVIENIQFSQPR